MMPLATTQEWMAGGYLIGHIAYNGTRDRTAYFWYAPTLYLRSALVNSQEHTERVDQIELRPGLTGGSPYSHSIVPGGLLVTS